jgi:hypothetical protein
MKLFHRIRYNRVTLFLGIVWRPVTGDEGDTWLQAWRKYRLDAKTAWKITASIYTKP